MPKTSGSITEIPEEGCSAGWEHMNEWLQVETTVMLHIEWKIEQLRKGSEEWILGGQERLVWFGLGMSEEYKRRFCGRTLGERKME